MWITPFSIATAAVWLIICTILAFVSSSELLLLPLLLVSLAAPAYIGWRVYVCWLLPQGEKTGGWLRTVSYASLPAYLCVTAIKTLLSFIITLVTIVPAAYAAATTGVDPDTGQPGTIPAGNILAFVLLSAFVLPVVDEAAKAIVVRASCCKRTPRSRDGPSPQETAASFVAAAVGFAFAGVFTTIATILPTHASAATIALLVLPDAALTAFAHVVPALFTALRLAVSDAQLVARQPAWSWPRVLWPAVLLRVVVEVGTQVIGLALTPGSFNSPTQSAAGDSVVDVGALLDGALLANIVGNLYTLAVLLIAGVILARQWTVALPTIAAGGPPPPLACVGAAAAGIFCFPYFLPCCGGPPAQLQGLGGPAYDAPDATPVAADVEAGRALGVSSAAGIAAAERMPLAESSAVDEQAKA